MPAKADELDLIKIAAMDREELVKTILKLKESTTVKVSDQEIPTPIHRKRDWSKVIHTCPRCDKVGDVASKFGFTVLGSGKEQAYSYCKTCRTEASNASHKKRRMAFKEKINAKRGGPRR